MSDTTEVTTVRHRVGTCPGCRSGLWAQVSLHAEVFAPTIDTAGKPHVSARPVFDSVTLTHECKRSDDGYLEERA